MFNGKTHYKWSFSIAMLVYQRVQFPMMVCQAPGLSAGRPRRDAPVGTQDKSRPCRLATENRKGPQIDPLFPYVYIYIYVCILYIYIYIYVYINIYIYVYIYICMYVTVSFYCCYYMLLLLSFLLRFLIFIIGINVITIYNC